MDVPASQEYMAFYQSRPQTVVTREQRPDGTSQVTRTTTRLVSAVSTGHTGGQPRPEIDGGHQSWQLSESFRSLTSPDGIQAYTANLEPQQRVGQTTTASTVSGAWSSEHDSPLWESWQSQPTEGHARFGTSWVVTRHDRSPSPMPFLAAAHPTHDTTDTHPQVVMATTGEPALSSLPGEPRIVSDTSVDDELRALSSLAGRQELAPSEVKLVESDFKREVEPLNLVSSRVVQDTEERKTIELKFQEKVQLVHYSFQLPSFAEFVEVPEEGLQEVRPLDSTGMDGVAASAAPGEKQSATERYSVRLQGSEVDTRKLVEGISAPETVSDVVSTRHSQGWTPSLVVDGGATVPAKPPTGIDEPKTTSKQEPSIHTPQHQQRAADTMPAETGKGVTSTLVFPADTEIDTSRSETQCKVISRTTVTVRQLSPGEGSTAADPSRSFPIAKLTEETGKEGQKEEPVLMTPKPGTAEVDAVVVKSRISKSPARGLSTSTTDVGTTVYAVTSELLSGAPQQPTDAKALEEQEKEKANGHPKHLKLQKKESPLPSVTVTKTLPGQHDVDSEKPTPLSETGKEPIGKPLPSQPQPDHSTPLLATETGKPTDPEGEERKAIGDDAPTNGEPKHLKKSSKKKKKDHSPSPAPQVQDTKTSSNPLDRFGKKVKKFAMNLFSGDSKHPSEVIPTDDAKKEQPVQPDVETKKDKKKKSKKKNKAPLPEEQAPVTPSRAETDDKRSPVPASPHKDSRSEESKPQDNDDRDTAPQPIVEFERVVPSAPFELEASFDDGSRPGTGAPSAPRLIEGLESIAGDVPSTAGRDSGIISERHQPSDMSSEPDDSTSIYSTGTDDSFSVLHSHRPYDEPKVSKGRQKKHKQRQKGETFLVASAVSSHAGRRSASKSPSPPSERDKPSTFRESRSPPPPGFLPDVLGQVSAPRWVAGSDPSHGTSLVERLRRDVVDYAVQAPAPERSAQPSSEKVDEFVKADTTTTYAAPPLPGNSRA
ncbi:hypothetical protein HPB52_018498 [Rhipicephalus sanguineus]|uniref:Uncharacterized protein n=1 Tax=Rhipicephalus sanguineus TaxID=34632 RepID=A0A9D4QAU7_RHISA|nr:hypothetical protein HPB52_018498 [Rhipicephalus sanguineus]